MPIFIDLLGYMAAILGTCTMVPQVIKSMRTKSVNDISNVMLAIYVLGCVLWTTYGYLIHSFPIIICNVVAFGVGIFQVYLKAKYANKRS